MFSKLRDKLKGFLGTKEETKAEKPKKEEKKKSTKTLPKKTNKERTVTKKEKQKTEKKPQVAEEKTVTKKEETQQEQTLSEEDAPEIQQSEKKQSFLSRFTKNIVGKTKTLSQEHIDEIFEPLELIFLENNVALEVVDKIKLELSKDLVGIEVKKDEVEKTISHSLTESISSILLESPNLIEQIKNKTSDPYIIIFFGINGSGKTTSLAKLANLLKKNKISCVLAAGDTFRAASIEQLEKHGSALDTKVIKQTYGADPTAVAFDAVQYAKKNGVRCVLIDTAGRMYTKSNLIKEMEKLIRVIKPDLKIFVGESITGNDVVQQAKTFNEAIGIDGIILTKADVDEKGGAMLSVSHVTEKPIYFLGTGQKYSDLEKFDKNKLLKNLGLD